MKGHAVFHGDASTLLPTAIVKIGLLVSLIAAAALAILWILELIPRAELGNIALKTFGVIAVVLAVAAIWRSVRGRADAPDKTDQPVP